jgi:cellulose synthase/poly-beta-1,6-N-acetylglucosamine synthase-like glycosyltransferase
MNIVLQTVLWGAVALLFYAYLLYPMLMTRLVAGSGHDSFSTHADSRNESSGSPDPLPTVVVIVAAFNEEQHIFARIENLLAQDYPPSRFKVFVGSDGSSDGTVELARRIVDARVEVRAFAVNRGKASVLNDLVAEATADVLVFTDANTVFRADTVRQLVLALNESTAATCGELILEAPDKGNNQDHRYWNFERKLKAAESSIGGLVGANGGVYAIRRDSFLPLRTDTICDDFVIAMNIAVRGQGLRYVAEAIAFEETPNDVTAEYYRRVRIGIGNYQALFRHPNYLFSTHPALSFTYFSHKVLRWLTPHLLLLILICSLLLACDITYAAVFAVQFLGYAFAYLVFVLRDRVKWPKIVKAGLFFAVLNVAFLIGFKRFIMSDYRGSWKRTERSDAIAR